MKKSVLIVLLLLSFLYTNAQTYPFQGYNLLINKAVESFITGDYSTADSSYQLAFKATLYPYTIDIQNALVNALKANEYKSAFSYAFMLSKLGAGSPYFKKSTFIASKLNKQEAWNSLIIDADNNRRYFDKKYATVLTALKRYNTAVEGLMSYYYQNLNAYSKVSAGIKTYSDSLYSLFKECGYMSEYEIGMNIQNDTTISSPLFSNIISYARYVFGENGSIEVAYNDRFEQLLTKALYDGKISPYYFYSVYTDRDFISVEYNPAYLANDTIFIPYMNDDDVSAISNKRHLYGLADINSYKNQLKYFFRNKNDSSFTLSVNIIPSAVDQADHNAIKIPL